MIRRAMAADPIPQFSRAVPDVAAYCSRIGYSGDLSPTDATLRALHRAHVGAIPFENIDVLLGRPILLDSASLQAKLVNSRRGGYCFEQNLLFKDVLEALGFTATGLAARVRSGSSGVRPRTHMAMLVDAEGKNFLADVGFGGTGLLEPLPFVAGREFEFPLVSFRLTESSGLWVLQASQLGGPWSDLYAFTLEPQERIDYEVANWFTSTYESSVFRHSLTAQRVRPDERVILRNRDLTVITANGEELQQVNSAAEARGMMSQRFGLDLPADIVLPESIFR
jgi:N-hydroxyarylamine O-acetyltransferase